MPLHRRIIWSALTVLALAPAVASAAGSGSTAQRHQMSMYKVERDLSLDAVAIGSTSMDCRGSDIAVDGMWRVTYTSFNPQLDDEAPAEGWNDYNGVQVWDSHSVGESTWRFTVYNKTSEAAQVKLWVTCLNRKVQPAEGDAHRHKLSIGPLKTKDHVFSAGGTPVVKAGAHDCPSNTVAVAPGFEVTKGDTKVFRSSPVTDLSAWEWGFYPQAATEVTTSVRCLEVRSSVRGAPSHTHNLIIDARGGHQSLAGGMTSTPRQDCLPNEKALLGTFDLRLNYGWGGLIGQHSLQFLGMEPQIKSRQFKVWNVDAGALTGHFGAICFNDRIGRRELA